MTDSNRDTKAILDRILKSYGVSSRPELAELLKIPLPTIQNWVSRKSLPGDYIIQCSLDTGADIRWLMNGELAKVSPNGERHPRLSGKQLHEHMLASGGKTVLQRVLHAYGFTMQKQLGELLDIPSATMSAWVRREYFPGDVVITCALDTGASLAWLATGIDESQGERVTSEQNVLSSIKKLPKVSIVAGKLVESGVWYADLSLFGDESSNPDYYYVLKGSDSWVVNFEVNSVSNGKWLLSIDGDHDIYDVLRLPGNKVEFSQIDSESAYSCSVDDIKAVGLVICSIKK